MIAGAHFGIITVKLELAYYGEIGIPCLTRTRLVGGMYPRASPHLRLRKFASRHLAGRGVGIDLT